MLGDQRAGKLFFRRTHRRSGIGRTFFASQVDGNGNCVAVNGARVLEDRARRRAVNVLPNTEADFRRSAGGFAPRQ